MNTTFNPVHPSVYRQTVYSEKDCNKLDIVSRDGINPKILATMDSRQKETRKASARILNSHLLMFEVMMCNQVGKYVYRVTSFIEQQGLMRFDLKRQCRIMNDLCSDLMNRCNVEDPGIIYEFTKGIYPILSKNYCQDGGSITQRLQAAFANEYDHQIQMIWLSTKNMLDKYKVKNSQLIADLQMILLFCHTGIEFYNLTGKRIDNLLRGINSVERRKSLHNEKMIAAARKIIDNFMPDSTYLGDIENCDARKLSFNFQKELGENGMLKLINSSITAMQMEFIEYTIVTLRHKLSVHTLDREDLRVLIMRMGNKQQARLLLKEISGIPVQDQEEFNAFNEMEHLSGSQENPDSLLNQYRRYSLNLKVRWHDDKASENLLRALRQMVYRSGRPLEHILLRWLYITLGTKKRVLSLLSEGGPVLKSSCRRFSLMRVSDLALNPEEKYEINVYHGIQNVLKIFGQTQEQFCHTFGITEDYIEGWEEFGDLSMVPGVTKGLEILIRELSVATRIPQRLILFCMLKESEGKPGVPALYQTLKERLPDPFQEPDESEEDDSEQIDNPTEN